MFSVPPQLWNTPVAPGVAPNQRGSLVKACRETILTAMKERHQLGHSMRGIDVRRETPSHPALLKAAVGVFGKWSDALLAAGIPVPVIDRHATRRSKYQSAADVLAEIKRRLSCGLPINTDKVLKGAQRDGNLYGQACKHCGTWQKTVEAAGFDYASHMSRTGRPLGKIAI